MAYDIKRFPYSGTTDADGHILEPADLWETYLEDRYRERALRIRVDDEGYEYLEIDGQPSKRSRKGSLGLLGAMGEAGVTKVLEILQKEFDVTMALCGLKDVKDASPAILRGA